MIKLPVTDLMNFKRCMDIVLKFEYNDLCCRSFKNAVFYCVIIVNKSKYYTV